MITERSVSAIKSPAYQEAFNQPLVSWAVVRGFAYQFVVFQELIWKSILDLPNVWVDFPCYVKNFNTFDFSGIGSTQ